MQLFYFRDCFTNTTPREVREGLAAAAYGRASVYVVRNAGGIVGRMPGESLGYRWGIVGVSRGCLRKKTTDTNTHKQTHTAQKETKSLSLPVNRLFNPLES
jgi:hypothetical protein